MKIISSNGGTSSGGGGTTNYIDLQNKPSIDGVELSSTSTKDTLNIASKTEVASKLSATNLKQGNNISLSTSGNDVTINSGGGIATNLVETVLFEGMANTVTSYPLADSLSNYDFILINCALSNASASNIAGITFSIPISSIVYGKLSQFVFSRWASGYINELYFYFSNATTLNINSKAIGYTAITSIQIYKITGYKNIVPTVITGGEVV